MPARTKCGLLVVSVGMTLGWGRLAAADPGFSVLSPNGGEVWRAGTTQVITWVPFEGAALLRLLKGGVFQNQIDWVNGAKGRYVWDICGVIGDGSDYAIEMIGSVGGSIFQDASDAPFTIEGSTPLPVIRVRSPNGGEVWPAGTTRTISWSSVGTQGDIRAYVRSQATGQVTQIGRAPMSAGTIDWSICPSFGDGPCLVTVEWEGCGEAADSSDAACTIIGSASRSPVVLTGPNGGEVFQAGSTQIITWTGGSPGQQIDAILLEGGAWISTVGSAPATAGHLQWDLCPDLWVGDDYQIWLRASGCGIDSEDVSDAVFSIAGSMPGPTLAVSSPNGGETFQAGGTYTISWIGALLEGQVSIYLDTSEGYSYLGSAPASAESFEWHICRLLPGDWDYRIVIFGQGCWMSLYDDSDTPFTIAGGTSNPLPTLNLTYPHGGEIWPAGTTRTVTWAATDPAGSVRLVLYDGQSYVVDTMVPMSAGSHEIALPVGLTPGMNYQVSLFWGGCGGELYDASGLFFVVPPGQQPGDLDGDVDVDEDDAAAFDACVTGPAIPLVEVACQAADLDNDEDVDQSDFGLFQRCLNGAGRPARQGCLN